MARTEFRLRLRSIRRSAIAVVDRHVAYDRRYGHPRHVLGVGRRRSRVANQSVSSRRPISTSRVSTARSRSASAAVRCCSRQQSVQRDGQPHGGLRRRCEPVSEDRRAVGGTSSPVITFTKAELTALFGRKIAMTIQRNRQWLVGHRRSGSGRFRRFATSGRAHRGRQADAHQRFSARASRCSSSVDRLRSAAQTAERQCRCDRPEWRVYRACSRLRRCRVESRQPRLAATILVSRSGCSRSVDRRASIRSRSAISLRTRASASGNATRDVAADRGEQGRRERPRRRRTHAARVECWVRSRFRFRRRSRVRRS